eukprot:3504210-Rhodomonas_salina.3
MYGRPRNAPGVRGVIARETAWAGPHNRQNSPENTSNSHYLCHISSANGRTPLNVRVTALHHPPVPPQTLSMAASTTGHCHKRGIVTNGALS